MDVNEVVQAQRRQRRRRFWIGFVAIAVVGGIWAFVSREPLGGGLVFGAMIP